MELDEAIRRVAGQHWRMILAFVAAAVAATALLNSYTPTYSASARLVLDAEDPQSRAEASGIADTARAIATSPGQIEAATRAAGVTGRGSVDVDRLDVELESLGASGVLELSVSDRDPRIVAPVANSLAKRVIETRLGVTRGQVDRVAGDLDARITRINRRIAQGDAGGARRQRRDAVQRRDLLVQARSTLEAQRVSLLSSGALQRNPRVISAATPPTHRDASNLLPDMLLAAFLGLVLGVGTASLLESVRPTLASGKAIARALDVPLLGTLGSDHGEDTATGGIIRLGLYLRLAAKAARVRNVRLVPADPHMDLTPLAARLGSASADPDAGGASDSAAKRMPVAVGTVGTADDTPESGGRHAPAPGGRDDAAALSIRPFNLHTAVSNGVATGLVLVTPNRLKRSELGGVTDLLRLTPAPLLGVVVYRTRRWSRS